MYTEALILETSCSPFGKTNLLLLTASFGKLFCSVPSHANVPSAPARIEVKLTQEKRGWYKGSDLHVEETFPLIRTNKELGSLYIKLSNMISTTVPLETDLPELWELMNAIVPCLHLFSDPRMALFLVAFSLALQQGFDPTYNMLPDMKNLSLDEILKMECPEQGLELLLEEISLGKRRNAKGGT